ncbi:MAG: hypothetical protein QM278_09550 [Pseudomonadota bacterium]|nr:hypothetical protein [Pseudomonadota bacterium]
MTRLKRLLPSVLAIIFFAFIDVAAAAPALYTGTLEVKTTSGRACTGSEKKKPINIQITLESDSAGISGFLSGDGIMTGRFSGPDLTKLTVVYPFADKALAEGHTLSLAVQGDILTGSLHERHLDDTVENCNYDQAELKLKKTGDAAATKAAQEKSAALFTAQLSDDQAAGLFKQAKYGEAEPLFKRSLAIKER